MKFCQQCGNQMNDADIFCQKCGAQSAFAPVNPAAPPFPPYPPYPATKKKVNPLAIILPVAGVLIIAAVLLIVLLTGGAGNTPSGIVRQYMDATKRGDMQAAIKCLTPEAQELANSSLDSLEGLMGDNALSGLNGINAGESLKALGSLYNYKIVKEEINGSNATVLVELEIMGMKQQVPMQCEKIDGKWYLSSI